MGIDNLFEKVVVLNVDMRKDDFQRIYNMLREVGYTRPVEQFLVGKGKLLPTEQYSLIDLDTPSQLWKNNPWRELENSYHAFRAFQTIIAQNKGMESLLILEDDCVFTDDFIDVIDKVEDEMYDKSMYWDILHLGSNHTWSTTQILSEHILKLNGSVCWHATGLNHTIYDHILSFDIDRPIDLKAAQELHHQYMCLATWPTIAIQRPGFSSVENKVRDYSEYWKNKGTNHA